MWSALAYTPICETERRHKDQQTALQKQVKIPHKKTRKKISQSTFLAIKALALPKQSDTLMSAYNKHAIIAN